MNRLIIFFFLVVTTAHSVAFSQTKQMPNGSLNCTLIDYSKELSDRGAQSSVQFTSDRYQLYKIKKGQLAKHGNSCEAIIRVSDSYTQGDIRVTLTDANGIEAKSKIYFSHEDKMKQPNIDVSVGKVTCICDVVESVK